MHLNHIRCLLFDLDDTLYSQSSGVWDMVRIRIDQYMQEEMGFPAEDVGPLRYRLFQQYGTTLRGLQKEYAVDMDAFLDYVHDIPLETVLKPNEELNQILTQFPQRKVVFTNANAAHAWRVLQALDVASHFEKIVDIYAVQPFCKPHHEAFHKALTKIDEKPEACLLIDDSPKNLETAKNLRIATVSVGWHRHDGSPHINTILDLPKIKFP
ncbi:MAG: pyrimidine 5'-nucleotidase [Brevefilum sp.]